MPANARASDHGSSLLNRCRWPMKDAPGTSLKHAAAEAFALGAEKSPAIRAGEELCPLETAGTARDPGHGQRQAYPFLGSDKSGPLTEPSAIAIFLMKPLPIAFAAAASLATLAVPSAAQALTWNFSFTDVNGNQATGTFQTAETTAQAGTTYSITSISGSVTYNGIISAITGLDSPPGNFGAGDNTFQRDGTASSPLLVNANGISFLTDNTVDPFAFIIYGNDPYPIYTQPYRLVGNGGLTNRAIVASSSLSPVASPVPGPLPLFGAGAAFGWSRRLRRRVMSSADPSRLAAIVPPQGWS